MGNMNKTVAAEPRQTFFSLLDENELYCIARMSSTQPNERWIKHLDPATVALLINMQDTMNAKLEIGQHISSNPLRCDWDEKTCYAFLPYDTQIKPRLRILQKFGSSIKSLMLDINEDDVEVQLVEAMVIHGTSLKKLDLLFPSRKEAIVPIYKLLEKRGNQLESLKIEVQFTSTEPKDFFDTVAANCINLEELKMSVHSAAVPLNIWKLIGTKLRSLSFENYEAHSVSTMSEIQTHCRALRKVNLYMEYNSIDLAVAVKNLLISYGANLKEIRVDNLEPKYCKEILAACPNALLETYSSWSVACPDTCDNIRALSAGLLWLSLGFDEYLMCDLNDLSNAVLSCTRLRTVHLGSIDPSVIEQAHRVLSIELPNLKQLILELDFHGSSYSAENMRAAWSNILQPVESNMRNLEKLHLSNLVVPENRLANIAKNNKNLTLVQIRLLESHCQITSEVEGQIIASENYPFNRHEQNTAAVELLNLFRGSSQISHMSIKGGTHLGEEGYRSNGINAIATACLPYRRRGMYVKVFGRIFSYKQASKRLFSFSAEHNDWPTTSG